MKTQLEQAKEVLTLPNLLAWAKSKPQDEHFAFISHTDCAIAQFLKAEGFEGVRVSGNDYRVGQEYYNDGDWINAPDREPIPEAIGRGVDRLLQEPGVSYTFAQLVDALEG